MKKLSLILAVFFTSIISLNAQEYIKEDVTANGFRNVETHPAIFEHQTELYLMAWNYISSPANNVDHYCLSIFCSDQAAPWNVSAGDKLQIGLLLSDEYVELKALMDAEPESYETDNGTKYRTLAYYVIPKSAYEKLYTGFDRFKIDVRVNNSVPITLAVKLPFSSVEHMLMSYLDIMIASGR